MITVITVISRTGSNNIILEIIRYIEDTTLIPENITTILHNILENTTTILHKILENTNTILHNKLEKVTKLKIT